MPEDGGRERYRANGREEFQALAAIALVESCCCNSGDPFVVRPQTPQRSTQLFPSGITGMKNSVNHLRDATTFCIVRRAHLEHGRSICPSDFALLLVPNRKNIGNSSLESPRRPGPIRAHCSI